MNGDVTVQSKYTPSSIQLHSPSICIVIHINIITIGRCCNIQFTGISNQYNDNRYLRKVCGILGIIKLINVKYLVVATHREFVGVIDNQVVWRLAGHDLIPFTTASYSLSDVQVS